MQMKFSQATREALTVFLLVVMAVIIGGCTRERVKPRAPLQMTGDTSPPPGCIDLRRRGGAC